MSEYHNKLKAINVDLAEARDDLHDAKISQDAELVAEIEKRIEELRQEKSDLNKATNVR